MGDDRQHYNIAEPGIKAEGDLLRTLRAEVAQLLGRTQFGFPGAQPVSFSRRHLEALKKEDYYVCEKSDGIRYLLYLTQDEQERECHYLIDRKNDYWYVKHNSLHFPRADEEYPKSFHTGTIIDGELVIDTFKDGSKIPKFLVFDLLALDGKSDFLARTLDKRLAYFHQHVMKPYEKLFYEDYPQERDFQVFLLEMKDMQFSYGMQMMFCDVLPKLRHKNDGLIFTCRTTSYQHGTDPNIIKWKAPHDNTVDFRLRLNFPVVSDGGEEEAFVDYDGVPEAKLFVFLGNERGKPAYKEFEDPLYLTEEEWERLKGMGDPLQDRVVECCLDEEKRWRLYRFRDDKNEANHVSTVSSVLESIRDGVSKADLLGAAKAIKDCWKMRHGQGH